MTQIRYNSDEVGVFHPAVQAAMASAITSLGLDEQLELVHHPSIPNSSIIPDFGIKIRRSQRYVFIVEVKRTERDVASQRYQNQSRSYVSDCAIHWEPGYYPYFCLTNIEELILFADRPGPISTCILKNNPKSHSRFDPNTHSADASIAEFEATMVEIIRDIYNRVRPEWDNNWFPIIDSFYENYESIRSTLDGEQDLAKELTLYELFRLLAFSFLKGYYQLISSDKASFFRSLPSGTDSLEQYKRSLTNAFDNVRQLDFNQVFDNYPDSAIRIFPENIHELTLGYFKNCIEVLRNYGNQAVADNKQPEYVFNLITSKVYDWDSMHKLGKVMTDRELAELLATVTIHSPNSRVIDPCCGDGALLDGAYHQLNMLTLNNGQPKSHNELLSSVFGIEIDPFLAQLATFRLVAKNLTEISSETEAEIFIGDTFMRPGQGQFDSVVMNPPFLRNDNPLAPITVQRKRDMIRAINQQVGSNFVEDTKQANLYFYFVNYAWHYLNDTGRAGLILMAKFLNSADGEHLKAFMLDKVDSIILYPRNYFGEFKVTTVITTLSKQPTDRIKFLRITDERLLAEPERINTIIQGGSTVVNDAYSLRVTNQDIDPSANWKLFLLDPLDKFATLNELPILTYLQTFFGTVKRGAAENSGGSKIIYPDFNSEPYQNIEDAHRGFGVQNSRSHRDLILTEANLEVESAIHFPASYDSNTANGLEAAHSSDASLNEVFTTNNAGNADKWKKIVNAAHRSQVSFDILIPRAERVKHSTYYNPNVGNVVLSTNFFFLANFHVERSNQNVSVDIQKKFIAGFLNSCFGQIQFEINSNNQEGLRKLEGFHIETFKVPDLAQLSAEEITNVVREFENYAANHVLVAGDEGLTTPRRQLDLAVGAILYTRDSLGYSNTESLTNFFELFLADLVADRKL